QWAPARVVDSHSSMRLSGNMFLFLAKLREKCAKSRYGSQPIQMHIALEEHVIRKSILGRLLDPLLRLIEPAQRGVNGANRIPRVVKPDDPLSGAPRLRHIRLRSLIVAARRA